MALLRYSLFFTVLLLTARADNDDDHDDADLRKHRINPHIVIHLQNLMADTILNGNAFISKYNRGDELSWTSGSVGALNLTVTGTWWLPPPVCAALGIPCNLEGLILPDAREVIGSAFTEDANYTEIRFDIPGSTITQAVTGTTREGIVRALIGVGWFADKLILGRHQIGFIRVHQISRHLFRVWAPVIVSGIAGNGTCKADPTCYPKDQADRTWWFDIYGQRAHTYQRFINGNDVKFLIKSVDGYGFALRQSDPPKLGNMSSLPIGVDAILRPYELDLQRFIFPNPIGNLP